MDVFGSTNTAALLGNAQAQAAQERLEQLSAERTPRTRADLERTAQEFEGVFLNTLLQAMRKTVPDNDLFNSGGATKFYRQMHDAELARSLAATGGGMGIAGLIVRQFAETVAADEADSADRVPAEPVPLGPPAPRALARYRSLSQVTQEAAARVRLQGVESRVSAAEADTLERFGEAIARAATREDLDPELVLAVVMEESGGDPTARSPVGAQGLMQLMPATAQEVGVADPHDPVQNLDGGARYLSRMLSRFDGRLDLALAAYNAGPGRVEKAGRRVPEISETRTYVDRVMRRYHKLHGGTELDTGKP